MGATLHRGAGTALHRGARAFHYRGPSRCGAQAPDAQAQQLWPTGPAAPWHVGSSQTRARTRVSCISRQILNHCATREALSIIKISEITHLALLKGRILQLKITGLNNTDIVIQDYISLYSFRALSHTFFCLYNCEDTKFEGGSLSEIIQLIRMKLGLKPRPSIPVPTNFYFFKQ